MARGRPVEFDHEQVLDAAMQLFWRQGYEATSLQDLLDATSLSRSSLYQAFGSKHALFEECIRRYRSGLVAQLSAALDRASTGRLFIEQTFLEVANEARQPATRKGCLVMNTASEFAQHDATIAHEVSASTRAFTRVFTRAVRRAQEEGDIPADREPQLLASYLVSSMAGLRNMVKAGAGTRTVREIAGVILKTLD